MKNNLIHKNDLVGKYVEFLDRDGKLRINKVKKVTGNYLTVMDATKRRRRIHFDAVRCQIYRGHIRVDIDKSRRNKK